MEGLQPEFKLRLSEPHEGMSEIAIAALHLSEGAERLALEDRTMVHHRDGRVENVAEHSNMLAIVAPALAEQFFPELDENLVARYAAIHDFLEAYVGDTPTLDISEEGLRAKEELEKSGLAQMKIDYAHLPKFVARINSYEQQIVPEARFVRVCDKIMPLLIHFLDGGKVLGSYIDRRGLLENSANRAASLRENYSEFEQLIQLREELSELAAQKLLSA